MRATKLIVDNSTIADLSFITWDQLVPWIFCDHADKLDLEKDYPAYFAWNRRLSERPAVKKIAQDKQTAVAANK
jgi:glutathione S-transferase